MNTSKAQTAVAACGSLLLLSPAMAALPVLADTPAAYAVTEHAAVAESSSVSRVGAADVQGAFSFGQNVVSSNASVKDVFGKAAGVLCGALPDYGVQQTHQALAVSARGVAAPDAVVDEARTASDGSSFVMTCACSTNGVAGGAIANAEVSGVMLKTLAALASA